MTGGESCGNFHVLFKYDDHEVDNAIAASVEATHCAAPLLELTGTIFMVDGDIHFTPQAGETCLITGELSADHSAVWVENSKTHAQVGNKLLIKGPAKMGFFGGSGVPEQFPPPQ
jgi:hypothetical protein